MIQDGTCYNKKDCVISLYGFKNIGVSRYLKQFFYLVQFRYETDSNVAFLNEGGVHELLDCRAACISQGRGNN